MKSDEGLESLALDFLIHSSRHKYSYNFDWLGLPIIQFPTDIVAIQELIWKVRPQVVIETGVARGGSVVLSASILELLGENGFVIGIDNVLRPANRSAIENHPLSHRIKLLEGSSTDREIGDQVARLAKHKQPAIVILDSLHTHEHVLQELRMYSPYVQEGSYLVVFDTVIERMPQDFFPDRPWGPGDNPMTAVRDFLIENRRFVLDEDIGSKLQITTARSGYLRCVE